MLRWSVTGGLRGKGFIVLQRATFDFVLYVLYRHVWCPDTRQADSSKSKKRLRRRGRPICLGEGDRGERRAREPRRVSKRYSLGWEFILSGFAAIAHTIAMQRLFCHVVQPLRIGMVTCKLCTALLEGGGSSGGDEPRA